jgi:hypothetical protein
MGSDDVLNSLPIRRSLSLNLLVAAGIAAGWCGVALWTIALAMQAILSGQTYEMVYVRLDGEPLIYRYGGRVVGGFEMLSLDRQPLSASNDQLLYGGYMQPEFKSFMTPIAAQSWQFRLTGVNDGRTPATYWYLVHDGQVNGRVYGVGYNAVTKGLVGYFGKGGFSTSRPPRDDWFQVAGSSGLMPATPQIFAYEPGGYPQTSLFLLAEGKLWSFNTQTREVAALLDAPRATTLGQAWVALDKLPPKTPGVMPLPAQYLTKQKVALRAETDLTLVDPESGDQSVFTVPAEMRKRSFAAYELASGDLLLISLSNEPDKAAQQLMWIARDGGVERERNVQLAQMISPQGMNAKIGWSAVPIAPLPLAHAGLTFVVPAFMVQSGAAEDYRTALGRYAGDTWPALLLVLAIGAAAAIAAYRRQRRYGLRYAGTWAALVFLLGVPGWIAYRYHRTWPVLEECAACHQASPRDRERCVDCGAEYPGPELKGIEVFA